MVFGPYFYGWSNGYITPRGYMTPSPDVYVPYYYNSPLQVCAPNPFNPLGLPPVIPITHNSNELSNAPAEVPKKSSQVTPEAKLDMKMEEELIVTANPIIGVVFRNYISNAIKYAKTGKKIIIDAIMEDVSVVVNVKDFGKTIEKKDRENIFTRQYQLSTSEGRGLGLSIVKRIAEAHKAEVGVRSNKPTGNIFYIKLPVL